jgi:hypothetical protein
MQSHCALSYRPNHLPQQAWPKPLSTLALRLLLLTLLNPVTNAWSLTLLAIPLILITLNALLPQSLELLAQMFAKLVIAHSYFTLVAN